MKKRHYSYYFMMLFALSSCVKIYTPKINTSDANKYVVFGQVTMGAQTQTVNISTTSSINSPSYDPVTGCKVTIQDNEHHNFDMIDLGNGDYSTVIDTQYLVPGHVFKVDIITPDGDSIVSDYDTLQQVPPVDSITYQKKDVASNALMLSAQGIQFYVDVNGTNADSRYYRWVIYETWKFQAKHTPSPLDNSRFTCWDTKKCPEIFTLSTANLSQNKYNKFPLQYISNLSNKLIMGYSMLLEQLAISKKAYNYWYQMETNTSQEGGLYSQRPITIHGNLHNITHPDKDVLGFFSAESASYKRIYVPPVKGIIFHYNIPACATCQAIGSTSNKPSFWPN